MGQKPRQDGKMSMCMKCGIDTAKRSHCDEVNELREKNADLERQIANMTATMDRLTGGFVAIYAAPIELGGSGFGDEGEDD